MRKFEYEMKENGFDLSITVSGKERKAVLDNFSKFPKMDAEQIVTHNGKLDNWCKRNEMLDDFYKIVSVCLMAWPDKINGTHVRRINRYNVTDADRMAEDCPLRPVFDERVRYLSQDTVTTYKFRRRSGKPHKSAQAKDGSYYVEAEHLPEILEALNACEKRASARTLNWNMLDLVKWICDGCKPVDTFEKMPKAYKYKVSYTWIRLNKAGNIIFGRDEAWGN